MIFVVFFNFLLELKGFIVVFFFFVNVKFVKVEKIKFIIFLYLNLFSLYFIENLWKCVFLIKRFNIIFDLKLGVVVDIFIF